MIQDSRQRSRDTEAITLLLLPGLDGTGQLFEPLLEQLPPFIKPLIQNYPVDASLGYSELGQLVLDNLPNDKPIFVLGESFSGPIAMQVAASRPEQVQGLILCCTFVRNPSVMLGLFKRAIDYLPFSHMPHGAMLAMLVNQANLPIAAKLTPILTSLPDQLIRKRLHEVREIDASAALEQIRCPILSLRGNADRLVPASAEKPISLLAGERLQTKTLAGPHALLQCNPQAVAQELEHFIGAQRRFM